MYLMIPACVSLHIGEIINNDVFIQGTPTQTPQQGINISVYTGSLNQAHVLALIDGICMYIIHTMLHYVISKQCV